MPKQLSLKKKVHASYIYLKEYRVSLFVFTYFETTVRTLYTKSSSLTAAFHLAPHLRNFVKKYLKKVTKSFFVYWRNGAILYNLFRKIKISISTRMFDFKWNYNDAIFSVAFQSVEHARAGLLVWKHWNCVQKALSQATCSSQYLCQHCWCLCMHAIYTIASRYSGRRRVSDGERNTSNITFLKTFQKACFT